MRCSRLASFGGALERWRQGIPNHRREFRKTLPYDGFLALPHRSNLKMNALTVLEVSDDLEQVAGIVNMRRRYSRLVGNGEEGTPQTPKMLGRSASAE